MSRCQTAERQSSRGSAARTPNEFTFQHQIRESRFGDKGCPLPAIPIHYQRLMLDQFRMPRHGNIDFSQRSVSGLRGFALNAGLNRVNGRSAWFKQTSSALLFLVQARKQNSAITSLYDAHSWTSKGDLYRAILIAGVWQHKLKSSFSAHLAGFRKHQTAAR